MTQVTGAYLDGLHSPRQTLKDNPWMTVADMRRAMDTAATLASRSSFAMRDCFMGERDFWCEQIKKKSRSLAHSPYTVGALGCAYRPPLNNGKMKPCNA